MALVFFFTAGEAYSSAIALDGQLVFRSATKLAIYEPRADAEAGTRFSSFFTRQILDVHDYDKRNIDPGITNKKKRLR